MTALPDLPDPDRRDDALARYLSCTHARYSSGQADGVDAGTARVVATALENLALDLRRTEQAASLASVHAALLAAARDHDAVQRFFHHGHRRHDVVTGVRGLELVCADRCAGAATELRRLATALLVAFAHDL